MKRQAEVRYPSSANLFQFCKKILDHRFGGIRIIDQDVGQILGFDPADCSHWKKGNKNVRSIQAMKAIAEHLGVDQQLVVDIASGEIGAEEGFFEYSGYGEFELQKNLIENARKEFLKKNISSWSKDKELEIKTHCDRMFTRINSVVNEIHKTVGFEEAPLYLPELMGSYPQITLHPSDDAARGENDIAFELSENAIRITFPKSFETRPFVRFQIARALASYFLRGELNETITLYNELSAKLNEIFCNVFAAKLLVPAPLIRKEMQNINLSRNIVAQLAEIFWVSKTFMNRRLKEVLLDSPVV